MTTPRDAGLTDADLETLRVAWRGPWGDDMVPVAPPRLVDAVERIVVAHLRDMATALSATRDHAASGCDCDNCAPWADAAAVVHERADRLERQWHPALSRWVCPDDAESCIAPPGNLCTDTGCWDADRCVVNRDA